MIKIFRETKLNNKITARIRYYTNKIVEYLNIEDKIITIVFVDDIKITELNQEYFNKNKSTNVIAFEISEDNYLGEIYISIDTAKREAQEWGVSLFFEIMYLIIHGILHLLGYNDLNEEDERVMEDKEIEIVNYLGLQRFRNENKD